MRHWILSALLLAATMTAKGQETHYHKGLRSQAENDKYGGVGAEPNFNGGGTYWSRVRNVDDMAITDESPADSIKRREEFKRLCRLAYDAYDEGNALKTIVYGDSALQNRYHTPDLYFFMAVSLEKVGSYASDRTCMAGQARPRKSSAGRKKNARQRRKKEALGKDNEKRYIVVIHSVAVSGYACRVAVGACAAAPCRDAG